MLNIIYFSSACPQRLFNEYFSKKLIKKLPQAQRFNLSLINGFASNDKVKVIAISILSFDYGNLNNQLFRRIEICENNVEFILPEVSIGRARRFKSFQNATMEVEKKLVNCDKKSVIFVVDTLNQTLGLVARKIAYKYGIKTLGIVTDVPTHRSMARIDKSSKLAILKYSILSYINLYLINKYDLYLLLTEEMNAVVNKNNRPHIVIEGMVESVDRPEKSSKYQNPVKIVMYAGGIHKEFGIQLMVDAFIQANIKDTVFNIYGNGNYENELINICQKHENINYLGTTTLEIIHKKQHEAYLLINPRLTNADYVKYSFPSKINECMMSGTALLTTRLPGIPVEYFPYLFFFEQETVEGFCECLQNILSLPYEVLYEKGKMAKEFILKNKNNLIQSKKILEFIEGLK